MKVKIQTISIVLFACIAQPASAYWMSIYNSGFAGNVVLYPHPTKLATFHYGSGNKEFGTVQLRKGQSFNLLPQHWAWGRGAGVDQIKATYRGKSVNVKPGDHYIFREKNIYKGLNINPKLYSRELKG